MIELATAAKAASTLYTFVRAGAVIAAMRSIGGVHMTAAEHVLTYIDQAANEREAVNRALTHLEAAHVAFRDLWASGSGLRRYSRDQHAKQDAWTCCLIALCHKALGDGPNLIARALNDARQAIAFESEARIEFIAHLLSPVFYYDIVTTEEVQKLPMEEFETFSRLLNA